MGKIRSRHHGISEMVELTLFSLQAKEQTCMTTSSLYCGPFVLFPAD